MTKNSIRQRLSGVAQEAAAALSDLQKKNGTLRPEDVLTEAEDATSPLHRYFDWDDSSAAAKYRLSQARNLIRSVQVTWAEPKGPRNLTAIVKTTRAFVNTTRDGSGYETIQSVLSNEEKRLRLMEQALDDLIDIQNRYEILAELSGVRVAIGDFAKKVNDYERRVVKKPAKPMRKAA